MPAAPATLSPRALIYERAGHLLRRNLWELAPRMRVAVELALDDCRRAGLDAAVNEALRTDELQRLYYLLGRPQLQGGVPGRVVTYARSALFSWHGYGLAIDVRSRSAGSDFTLDWITAVARIMKGHGLDWGGDWIRKDFPHFQWGTLKPAPSDRARSLLAEGGLERVWREVGAA